MSSRIINLCCLLCCSNYVSLAFKEPGPYYYFFYFRLLVLSAARSSFNMWSILIFVVCCVVVFMGYVARITIFYAVLSYLLCV
jgi:hypothetical protein